MDRYDLEPSGKGRVEQASIGQRQEGLQEGGKGSQRHTKRVGGRDGLRSLAVATETSPARLTVLVESNKSKYYLRLGSCKPRPLLAVEQASLHALPKASPPPGQIKSQKLRQAYLLQCLAHHSSDLRWAPAAVPKRLEYLTQCRDITKCLCTFESAQHDTKAWTPVPVVNAPVPPIVMSCTSS